MTLRQRVKESEDVERVVNYTVSIIAIVLIVIGMIFLIKNT